MRFRLREASLSSSRMSCWVAVPYLLLGCGQVAILLIICGRGILEVLCCDFERVRIRGIQILTNRINNKE